MTQDIYKIGVYQIKNIITGKIYIGSTGIVKQTKSLSGFYRRFEHHKQALRLNKHSNRHLQKSWNKYEEECFEFTVIAKCPPEYCIKLEQWFIDNLKPEYNIRKIAKSNRGIKQTDVHIQKRMQSLVYNYYNNPERRSRHGNLKLTVDNVKDIKYLLANGYSFGYCAKKYNVCRSTISNIKINKTWKDIKYE